MESETSHEVMKSTTNTPTELTQPHSFRENLPSSSAFALLDLRNEFRDHRPTLFWINKSNKLVLTSLVYHVVSFTMGNDVKTHPHSNTRTICGLLDQHTRHLDTTDWGDFVAFNLALTYQYEPSPQSAYTQPFTENSIWP